MQVFPSSSPPLQLVVADSEPSLSYPYETEISPPAISQLSVWMSTRLLIDKVVFVFVRPLASTAWTIDAPSKPRIATNTSRYSTVRRSRVIAMSCSVLRFRHRAPFGVCNHDDERKDGIHRQDLPKSSGHSLHGLVRNCPRALSGSPVIARCTKDPGHPASCGGVPRVQSMTRVRYSKITGVGVDDRLGNIVRRGRIVGVGR